MSSTNQIGLVELVNELKRELLSLETDAEENVPLFSVDQVELELQESMTALGSIHSQVELVDSGDVRSGRAELLKADIRNQVDRLSNLTRSIAQQRQRISDAASGGSFSI